MSSDHDFPALTFDPAPGRPASVDALVSQLTTAANALESASNTLTSISHGGSAWEGKAADGFARNVGELPKTMDDSLDALRSASTQLSSWSKQLVGYQQTARRYEAEAEDAKRRLKEAEARRSTATDQYNSAADDPAFKLIGYRFSDDQQLAEAESRIRTAQQNLATANQQLQAASQELSSIEDELHHIVKQAKELHAHHQHDADRTAKALRSANHNAPHIGTWSKIADGFKKVGKSIKDWAHKHAGVLKKIGDIAGAASAVLGIAALATMWCPPLSAALGVAAAGASGIALGAHGLAKLGGADVSWTTIALDGVGVVPFLGGAAKGIKGVTMGVKAIKAGEGLAAGGAKLAEAGKAIESTHMAGGLLHSKVISPVFTKTPLRNLPGAVTTLDKAGKEVLSASSWWSRGIQIGMKGTGLGMHAPTLYQEVTS
ncbi:putative T7SS-secreted protein [Kitasatospora sp. HPMI-4]|uniref:WXG100 family type VII secretion target n=1 Tax=Kitasatospora sp. HPMI-4 TaxID=3448443 RepID=UPI003F1CCEA8